MHPELDSDLKDMSEELRTKCINKISEIKEKGIPSDTKTIKRIGGNSSSSIIKVRYHSKNSEAFRMYLRRISDEEYLILGVSAKESNNTAENKTHNKMFNRLDKYLEEQKKAAH